LSVIDVLGERREATPVFVVEGNQVVHRDDATTDAQFKFRLNKVIPEQQEIELLAYQNIGDEAPFIVIKAVIFPWINLLWLGSVLMALGTVMAIYRRVFKNSIGK
jgi:cytochrome c-type biogenesis protein CcmF